VKDETLIFYTAHVRTNRKSKAIAWANTNNAY